ncbi:MAG TPA: DUF5667 domain-containing protein [Candidatus Methanoperedens sp.]
MRLRNITLAGIILLVLAFTVGMAGATENGTANETPTVNATETPTETPTVNATGTPTETFTATPTATAATIEADDDEAGKGIFGPGHLLYRLQIAFENMDEVFTYNASEKLGKQVSNARHRINEYRAALKRNDTEAADIVLAEYGVKMNQVEDSMSKLSDKDTGFINAQQMILKHKFILENLSISHPNSTGLQRAYNNSKNLQAKFASKMGQKPGLNSAKENREISQAEKTGVPVKDDKPEKGTKR